MTFFMLQKKNIIFDFDGTIADTIPLMRTIAQHIADEGSYGLTITEDDWEWVRNHTLMELPKKFGVPLYKVPGLIIKGRETMKKLGYSVAPCKGVPHMLRALKKAGFKCAILSSTSKDTIQEFLIQHTLVDIFDFVHSELNLFGKDVALKGLMSQHNILKDEVTYVGDELRDLEACQKIDVDCISVTWGLNSKEAHKAHGAQYIVESPEELLSLVKINND